MQLLDHKYSLNYLRIFRFRDYDKEHNAGVTTQQRMLTPPWNLILPPIFLEVRVRSVSVLYFSFGLLVLNTVRYYHVAHAIY